MILHIQNLIDDAKCFETVRQLRWPEGVVCPSPLNRSSGPVFDVSRSKIAN
jgi:hypothetical protein